MVLTRRSAASRDKIDLNSNNEVLRMLKRPGPSQILRTIRIAVSGDEKEWELSTTQREPSHPFKI